MVKIAQVKPGDGFRLWLRFSNGVEGIADLSDLAGRGVFKIWDNPSVFENVSITDVGALEWPNEIDLCADALFLRVTGQKPSDVFESLTERVNA